jgi:soluble lytic murein transglycosylase-like protein
MRRVAHVTASLLVCCSHVFGQAKVNTRAEAEYYVDAYAEHYDVPPELVRAVIAQESGWNPQAVSYKGAKGLMQLMPKTAIAYSVSDPFDISQNISGGVRYLADLIQQFHGDWRLVLAAYNCGSKWILAKGLNYQNPAVFQYVAAIRRLYIGEVAKTMELTEKKELPDISASDEQKKETKEDTK